MNRWLKGGLCLLGVASASGLFLLLQTLQERDSRLPNLALTLQTERVKAREATLPKTMADLNHDPLPVADRNAAPLYRAAVELLPTWTPEEKLAVRRYLDLAQNSPRTDKALLESLLDRITPAVKPLRLGVVRPDCDFGWHDALPEDGWKRRRTVLLGCDQLGIALQVYALGSRRDPQRALEVLSVVERLTRHLTQEGGMLVWQIRATHTHYAARLLALLARDHPERVGEIEQQLRAWQLPEGALDQAWRLQCVKEQADAARARVRPYKTENEPFLDYNPLWRELDRLDHRLGWQLYADASETINLRYWRKVKAALEASKQSSLGPRWRALRDLDQAEDAYGKTIPGYWFPQRYSGHAAQLLMAELALEFAQLELTLRRTGSHPTARDPFSGKPLIWKDDLVYSVGPDGKDDGGVAGKDVVWNLEKKTAPLGLRSRKGTMRRPGHQAGPVE